MQDVCTSKMASLSRNTCHIFDHLLGLIVTTKRLPPLRMGQTDVNETERTWTNTPIYFGNIFEESQRCMVFKPSQTKKLVMMVVVTWLHGSWLAVKMHHKSCFSVHFWEGSESFSARPRGMWKPGAWTGDMERDSVESRGGFAEEGEEGSVMVITWRIIPVSG